MLLYLIKGRLISIENELASQTWLHSKVRVEDHLQPQGQWDSGEAKGTLKSLPKGTLKSHFLSLLSVLSISSPLNMGKWKIRILKKF